MALKRQPGAIWQVTRRRIWARDRGRCQGPYCRDRPAWSLPQRQAHVDHILSGWRGTNRDRNLRVLCHRCHALRRDRRHRGLIHRALRRGLIPPNWRDYLWDG